MRIRLLFKPKSNNYTESFAINVAGRWRERNVWYPGRPVRYVLKRINIVQGNKTVQNAQESAEAIVAERRRAESTEVLSISRKGGMRNWMQKTIMKAAHKGIARNAKSM
jgi:hypothetical protein